MSRRSVRYIAAATGMLAGLFLMIAPPATAADSTAVTDDGWWWRLQTGVGAEIPPPTNVGEDQLMVQGAAEGAQAIAAIAVQIADHQTSPILTLDVSDDQGGAGALLIACQAGSAWTGAHAGGWGAKPSADCATSVTGIRSDDGTQWTFPLGSLQFNDQLNVVLVPGAVDGVGSTFSLVFDAPTASSIATTAGAQPPPPTTAAPTTAPPTTQASTFTPSPAPSPGFTPAPAPAPVSPPTTAAAAPVVPVQPALDPEDQGQTATAPIVNAASPPAIIPEVAEVSSRSLARAVGVIVFLGALAGAFFAYKSSLLSGEAATADAPIEGGLSRFRRVRDAEPIAINA